jgi:hypothetical protein
LEYSSLPSGFPDVLEYVIRQNTAGSIVLIRNHSPVATAGFTQEQIGRSAMGYVTIPRPAPVAMAKYGITSWCTDIEVVTGIVTVWQKGRAVAEEPSMILMPMPVARAVSMIKESMPVAGAVSMIL